MSPSTAYSLRRSASKHLWLSTIRRIPNVGSTSERNKTTLTCRLKCVALTNPRQRLQRRTTPMIKIYRGMRRVSPISRLGSTSERRRSPAIIVSSPISPNSSIWKIYSQNLRICRCTTTYGPRAGPETCRSTLPNAMNRTSQ